MAPSKFGTPRPDDGVSGPGSSESEGCEMTFRVARSTIDMLPAVPRERKWVT